MRPYTRFSLVLILMLAPAFALQTWLLHRMGQPLFGNRIIQAYVMNYFLAILIYGMLYLLRVKMTAQLGFLYMGGSMVKFVFFFIFFYPYYRIDGHIDSLEFAAFFVPYVICLVAETFGVIQFLKK